MKKIKLIACKTMEEEFKRILPENIDYRFLEYALHSNPDKLRSEIQKSIDEASEYNILLLGYGLCSYGVVGLTSKKHYLVVPRVHDCISLLLGSREKYNKVFKSCPGTFYLSRGWVKQGADPLASFQKDCKNYGEKMALRVKEIMYQNYERLLFIKTLDDCKDYIEYSQKVADFVNVELSIVDGSLTFMEKLLKGPWDDDFVVTPPGQSVNGRPFMW